MLLSRVVLRHVPGHLSAAHLIIPKNMMGSSVVSYFLHNHTAACSILLISLQIGITPIYHLYLDSTVHCRHVQIQKFYHVMDNLSYVCIMYFPTKFREQKSHETVSLGKSTCHGHLNWFLYSSTE